MIRHVLVASILCMGVMNDGTESLGDHAVLRLAELCGASNF